MEYSSMLAWREGKVAGNSVRCYAAGDARYSSDIC